MAAIMAPQNFSASTSSFRTSQSQSAAPMSPAYSDNPLTQLPRVEFNFDDLRQRMTAFTVKFDAFIEKGRKRVLEERNEFRGRLGELSEDRKTTAARIANLTSALSSHSHILTRESAEKAEMHAAISSLTSAHSSTASTCARLRTAIASTQRQIDAKRSAQRAYAEKIEQQSRLNGPELGFWETYLGVRIEGSGREDVVRVVFEFEPNGKNKGKGDRGEDGEREGTLELRVPDTGAYEVVFTKPRLEEKSVQRCVEKFNESRDMGGFLKGMRGLFGEVLR